MKRITVFLMAIAMIATMAMSASAEYVACLPNQEHAQSEWVEVSKNENGGTVYERTCSKCGYVQTGIGGSNSEGGVATTRDLMVATTLSMDLTLSANPSTGARA